MKLRFIGDVHGNLTKYAELAVGSDISICLGEMGFYPLDLKLFYDDILDPKKHIIVPGNHDNYEQCQYIDTFLTHPGWGMYTGGPHPDFFYVRGAESVPWDKMYRTKGIDWWAEEELSQEALDDAYKLYCRVKPKIMVTHTCPQRLVQELIGGGTVYHFRTELTLDQMFEVHKPDLWVFGHFHVQEKWEQDGTTFAALGALGIADLEIEIDESK